MARGYAGRVRPRRQRAVDLAALCALFVLPFVRPPLRLLHLDLAVLLAFSVSYAFFNASRDRRLGPARLSAARLPARAHARHRVARGARARAAAAAADASRSARSGSRRVFLLGFRCGLNVVGSNVIDVGYASVIGADRFGAGEPVYGNFPLDNPRGDTYGPVLYYAYVPFEALLPWSGTWDDLPAAHAAAIAFDLLHRRRAVAARPAAARARRSARCSPTCGRRSRSRCWWPTRTPTTALVALLVTAAMLALARPVAARRASSAAAALTKFAPLVLAPLFATYRARRPRAGARRSPRPAFAAAGRARARPGGARGRPGHVLRPHARLPGRPRLAVLGLGPVRPRPAAASPLGRRARARGRRRLRPAPARPGHASPRSAPRR